MRNSIRARAALVAAFVTMAALGPVAAQEGHSPIPAATPASGSAWTVTETREIAVDGTPVTLSPDGQWVAGIGEENNVLCVWDVATLEPACDNAEPPIHPDSVTWAPDSTAVAYSIDAAMLYLESDLFVFELATGQTTNLTDDGLEGGILSQGDAIVPVDTLPLWAPDSQSLTFVRSTVAPDTGGTDLMTIDRAGGEPRPRYTVSSDTGLAISSPMIGLAGGGVLFTVWMPNVDDPASGIWLLDSGSTARQVLASGQDAPYPFPVLTDLSESADGILVSGYSAWLNSQSGIDGGAAFLLDPISGTVTAVANPDDGGSFGFPPSFGPDGVSTLTLDRPADDAHLVIQSDGGTTDLGPFLPSTRALSRGIDWAANNAILLVDAGGNATLVTVSPPPPYR